MYAQNPMLDGNVGLKAQNQVPDYTPERLPELHYAYRRLPSVLRVANPEALQYLPPLTEGDSYAATRYWMDPSRRRLVHVPPGHDAPHHVAVLQRWLTIPECKHLLSWWKKPDAWRSPREFVGYGSGMEHSGTPHLEPYEVANFRLPDDISCDADVVLFQAWCQGWTFKAWQRGKKRTDLHATHWIMENYAGSVRRGLHKFARSPYIRFAVAAPYMNGTGIQFTGQSLFDSSIRMEYLVKSPFMATDKELECILHSPVYQIAARNARVDRKKGKAINPPGGWYSGNSINYALGTHFRRGGLQPSRLYER